MKVTCASVLKPVYAWLCPSSADRWDLAAAAIVTSDNTAATELASRIGSLTTLGSQLSQMAGRRVALAEDPTWGRFLVDDPILEAIYRTMLRGGGPDTERVVDLMRHVIVGQRFGVEAGVPMKAGWFLPVRDGWRDHLVTNVVRLDGDARTGWTVRARTGSVLVSDQVLTAWDRVHADCGPSAVIPIHSSHAPHLADLRVAAAAAA